MATREEKKKFLKGYYRHNGSVFIYGDMETREKVEKAIESVNDRDLKELLRKRYICGDKWERISIHMHISRATTFRYHNIALDALQIPEE